jgi:hypothetical protein
MQYARQLNILTNHTTDLRTHLVLILQELVRSSDWLVENMNPDMTPYVMSLDFIVYYQNKHKKTTT